MTGRSYATSAEIASEIGAFPRYEENADNMLRVMRNHRRAAHSETKGYEGLSVLPVPLDADNCPEAGIVTTAAPHGMMPYLWVRLMAIVTHNQL